MLFNELGLSAELLRAVSEQGYETLRQFSAKPYPIFLKAMTSSLAPRQALARRQVSHCRCCSF